jgi:hypothetical protein
VAFARKAWRDCHTYRVTVAFTVVGALAAFAVFVMRGRLVT